MKRNTIIVKSTRIPCIQIRYYRDRSSLSDTIASSVATTLCPVTSIKVIVKIDIADDACMLAMVLS